MMLQLNTITLNKLVSYANESEYYKAKSLCIRSKLVAAAGKGKRKISFTLPTYNKACDLVGQKIDSVVSEIGVKCDTTTYLPGKRVYLSWED